MEENKKPQYGIFQCIKFMLRKAWHYRKSVIWLCLVYATIRVCINISQLFIAPVVLDKVESTAPLRDLLGSIVVFSFVLITLNALLAYVDGIV